MNIIARYKTIPFPVVAKEKHPNIAYEIISDIQHNIYDNDSLAVEHIADCFHFSKNYVGAYFLKHTGKTIKQFILDYKLQLVKTRLMYSQLTVSQISAKSGLQMKAILIKYSPNNMA